MIDIHEIISQEVYLKILVLFIISRGEFFFFALRKGFSGTRTAWNKYGSLLPRVWDFFGFTFFYLSLMNNAKWCGKPSFTDSRSLS